MPATRTLFATAFAAVSLALTSVAFAAPGIVQRGAPVYSGPGNGVVVGQIERGTPVDVGACQANYCQVNSGSVSGWVEQYLVTGTSPAPQAVQSGQQPDNIPGFNFDFNFGNGNGNGNPGPFPPRPPRPPVERQSGACFYASTNFRGPSFCVDRGDGYDYLPGNWDNAIRSVEVFGRARVDLCRDEDLDGACVTLRSSQSRLPSQLDRRASSLDVY